MNDLPPRPLLIFDGDCGFCRYWINRWRHKTRDRVDYEASQDVGDRFPQVPEDQFDRSVVLVESDGRITTGAHAVFRAYAEAPLGGWPLAFYEQFPGFATCTEWGYRFIASHRLAFSRITRWMWGRVPEPSSWHFTRSVFIRALGLVYLIAFVSLWVQVDGLIGNNGIMPANTLVERIIEVANQRDTSAYTLAPTLSIWFKGDGGLHAQCAAGALISIAVMLGFCPGLFLVLLWVLYLSLTFVGQTFLGFQWENLLLETGLLAIFLCPWRLRLPNGPQVSPSTHAHKCLRLGLETVPFTIARLLLWWLLFRLMLQSGMVKLASNDQVWWDLTALNYHYWTQPLATWTSYYVHHMPPWFHKFSVFTTYIIEIVFPFLMIGPRRIRMIAFWGFSLLMGAIAFTGNYTYFNLLTFVLCVLLIDDQSWPQKWRHALAGRHREDWTARHPKLALPLFSLPAGVILLILLSLTVNIAHISWYYMHRTTLGFAHVLYQRIDKQVQIARPEPGPRLLRRFQRFSPLRCVNSYGLFADMTEKRPEIIIEGSNDLVEWRPYEFKWKPGRLDRRPGFVQPHQPRLDWQMWFAALGNERKEPWRDHPWLLALMNHMLRGTLEPLTLLEYNPFPETPPRFVMATTYDYAFTTPAEKRETGNWWRREAPRPYTPPITLRDDQLVAVSPDKQ